MRFEIATPQNTQRITLGSYSGRTPVEDLIISRAPQSIALAVVGYAKRHGIPFSFVNYSVREELK